MSSHKINLVLLAAASPPELPGKISLEQASARYGAEDADYLSRYTSREALSLRLQARSLLRYGLLELGLARLPVHILKTKDGRPYLPLPGTAVSFSYTDRALCLLGATETIVGEQAGELCIGADWEEKRSSMLPPAFLLALDRTCTAKEDGLDEAARILAGWCRTEAVLKAAGCGLRIHPRDIEWMPQDKGRSAHAGFAIVQASKTKELYTWQDVQPDNQHLCSVAVKGEYEALSVQVRFVSESGISFA